jgi:hypothetical protein
MIKFLRSLFSKPKREYDFIILSIESPYYSSNSCRYVAMDQNSGEIVSRLIHGTKTIDKDALIKTLNNGGLPGVKV